MITTFGRRAVAAVAGLALAGTGLFGATTAIATTSAANSALACLNALEQPTFFDNYGQTIISPANHAIRTLTLVNSNACQGAVATVGISKPYSNKVYSAYARIGYDGEMHYLASKHQISLADTGHWRIRQIAVTKNGVTKVKNYDLADIRTTSVRRASILTGSPKGSIPVNQWFTGYLKAYTSTGSIVPLKGRTMVLQASRNGLPYKDILVKPNATHANGYYLLGRDLSPYRGHNVRAVFKSPYETIASSYVYLGVVR
ncbi:hypothetical protein OG394_14510 [Kribbella sp. NBC_01245]|uniref:hypothetical protein n=1 Tax=Kribbella sp. NBC_01245 TaxID=2903578 RepID=UPI002E2A9D9E|nr:hypothetical protein [Kribbella sp. NBC_01245]